MLEHIRARARACRGNRADAGGNRRSALGPWLAVSLGVLLMALFQAVHYLLFK